MEEGVAEQVELILRVAEATRDVRAVQRRLKHTSASFTLETYVHLLDDRAGVDAVAKALDAGSH